MNPLALLCVGMYGETLPNQDGAPVRMVIPWKYGFKSIKSIVKIRFVKDQPPTTWNITSSERIRLLFQCESQRRSSALEPGKGAAAWRRTVRQPIPTLMFNGYGDQVASLYTGMDLRKNF